MRKLLPIFLLAAVLFVSGCVAPPAKDYTEFATCISESGIEEFGAYWCPNCAKVKLTFGDAWHNLNYVECDPKCVPDSEGNLPGFCVPEHESQTDLCLELGISKYPSWVKDNNILYIGTDMNRIAEVSGCQLPE